MAQTNCVMQLCRGNDSAKKGSSLYKNVWRDGRMQSYCTTFFCPTRICQAEVHKDTVFPHVPFNHSTISRFFVGKMSARSCDHAKQLFHIQLCKGLGGIPWHENLRRQENTSNCRIVREGKRCFLYVTYYAQMASRTFRMLDLDRRARSYLCVGDTALAKSFIGKRSGIWSLQATNRDS